MVYQVITDFLNLRKQRLVLNGQLSLWSNIEAGVPKWRTTMFAIVIFVIFVNICHYYFCNN